jgi:hypothetical protein
MTASNLGTSLLYFVLQRADETALVMAPNLLRTTSDSLATVFTNSAFESKFVMNLLEHMDPQTIDPGYIPQHGRVSVSVQNTPR